MFSQVRYFIFPMFLPVNGISIFVNNGKKSFLFSQFLFFFSHTSEKHEKTYGIF